MRRGAQLAVLAVVLGAHDALAARSFARFGAGRGLDAVVAVTMLVDRQGLLWVGSREGLYRYDGYHAEAFLPDTARPGTISDADVRRLYEAGDGALWVATNTGGLNRRDPASGEFTQFHHDSAAPDSLSDESVYGLAEDAEGRLWAGTQHGLNRLQPDGRTFARYFHRADDPASLAADWVYALHRGPSGRLWIGTVGGGLDRWAGAEGGFEHFPLAKLAGGPRELDDVFALHEAPDGRVWAGTRAGLVVLEPQRRRAERFDLTDGSGDQPLVTAMHADRAGQLWVATTDDGVFRVDPASGRWSRAHPGPPGAPGNLPAFAALSLATTDHMIFAGTWGGGVYRAPLEAPEFRFVTRRPDGSGLRFDNVTAVLGRPRPGQPWVGTFGGGPQRVDVASLTAAPGAAPAGDALARAGVHSLAVTADGLHFAGATDGLYRFDEDGRNLGLDAHAAERPDGIGPGYVTALLPAAGSDLWVGVGGSGLFLRDGASGRYRGHRHDAMAPGSVSGDFVSALADGAPGHLWVGTRSNGLNHCRIEPWSCERFDGRTASERNLGHYHVTALRRDGSGALWVATNGGGLHRVQTGADGRIARFERWGTERGLPHEGIMSLEPDDDGTLWISTLHGLTRLDPDTGRVTNHVVQSGLPAGRFNAGASSADDEFIYFGAVEGLVAVPRGTPLRERAAHPVRVTAIERLIRGVGQPLPPAALAGGFEVDFDDVLALEFAVLDFAETPHEYAYRLGPYDDWIALGRRRQVTFVGLAPGSYRFEVQGRDLFGQWSKSPPLEFAVVPPVWMTPWFRMLAATLAVLLVLGVHRARVRTLSRRNARLERLKQQREQALERAGHSQRELEEAYAGLRQLTGRLESAKEDERSRISRELHDEFGQTLTAAKINLQLLRRTAAEPSVAQRLDDSVAMVDGMIRQARDIARGLRPPLLDEAGLVPALDHHLKALAERSGVAIELDAAPGVADLPPGHSTTVFRVVQEAVSNALRHARARTIRVRLSAGADALQLVVEDDGVGFDPEVVGRSARRGEHLGLLGMTERVRSAGGTIRLDSRPGAGSRIEVRVPIAP